MECIGDKCALGLIYPNTTAIMACDCDCNFKWNSTEKYIEEYPEIMKECGFKIEDNEKIQNTEETKKENS